MEVYVDELPNKCKGCPMLEILYPYGNEDLEVSGLYCKCNNKQIVVKEDNLILDLHIKELKKYSIRGGKNSPIYIN